MAMGGVARVAALWGYAAQVVNDMETANTVEAAMERLKCEPGAQAFWIEIERRIGALAHARVPSVKRLEVRLFDLAGNPLGVDA
jgi:cobalt-precorrin-5B (C1)-methyltransferase